MSQHSSDESGKKVTLRQLADAVAEMRDRQREYLKICAETKGKHHYHRYVRTQEYLPCVREAEKNVDAILFQIAKEIIHGD